MRESGLGLLDVAGACSLGFGFLGFSDHCALLGNWWAIVGSSHRSLREKKKKNGEIDSKTLNQRP
jgi:hypothetical protein